LLLEGSDLQELLAQVREEHGARAKIVSAERVRAGGLTGLLRAERYELTVELPDEAGTTDAVTTAGAPDKSPATASAAPAAMAASATPAASGASAASAASATTTAGNGTGSAPRGAGATAAPPVPVGPIATANRAAIAGSTPKPANASRQLTAAPRPSNPPAPGGARTPSDNGQAEHGPDVDELLTLLEQRETSTPDSSSVGGFDEVLAELRGTNGSATASAPATPAAAAPAAAEPAAPVASASNGTATTPGRPLTAAGEPLSDETIEFSLDPIFAPASAAADPSVSAGPAGSALSGTGPGSGPAGTALAGTALAGTGSARTASATAAPHTAGRMATPRATTKARPLSPDPTHPNRFVPYPDFDQPPAASNALPALLADLGLPDRVLQRLPQGESYASIVRALLDEPPAPPLPTGPGMIITIIGELTGALAVAEDVARILRLDAGRILIASESPQVGRHIADPGDAGRQAVRLRGGDQPRIVCVDSPGPTSWVQQVVIALRPDAVWCAVDATRKPADVARQLRSLPRVDALAVHALEATADPASPLALGVPVAMLDGQPAGPHGWAALLCRRLFEEEESGVHR
jgi:hypothetical protein